MKLGGGSNMCGALKRSWTPLWIVFALGCGSDPGSDPPNGFLDVTGTVVDFETGMPVAGAVTVSTTALQPAPMIDVVGAAFTISNIPENSTFQLLATAPAHRATYSPPIEITTIPLDNVKGYAVGELFLNTLASGFGVTPSPGNGMLLVQLTDATGPKAGIAGSNLLLFNAGTPNGPHFLDANLAPSTATSTSSSGWAVFFDVTPGLISLGQAATATVALDMPSAIVDTATVTIGRVNVGSGPPPPLPTNVSFSQSILPIFQNRGCVNCHSGNGIGKDLGNLTLDGSSNKVYMELTGPEDPLRVQVAMPEKSKVLTMPSAEDPPDAHPNVTFTGPQDPDYLKLLVWIREGAKQN
jgi:hypothetical protein